MPNPPLSLPAGFAALARERLYYRNLRLFLSLCYICPVSWFFTGALVSLCESSPPGQPLRLDWAWIWRAAVAAAIAWQGWHSAHYKTCLYYPLELWDLSLSARESSWRDCHRGPVQVQTFVGPTRN